MILAIFITFLFWCPIHASLKCDSFHTYTLNYETAVDRDLWKTFGGVKDDNDLEPTLQMAFTSLSTEIAADFVEIDTDNGKKQDDARVELDRRCYETLIGGGRCNIDHYQVNGTTLQLVTSYVTDHGANANIRISIEATLMSNFARDTLIKSIPRLNDRLRSFHGMFWTIQKQRLSSQRMEVDHPASLESMILERYNLENRMRIASSGSVEVWQYQDESGTPIRALFRDGYLLSTTQVAGRAHAEALVHPSLISGVGDELSVIILSQEPTLVLKEVLKHMRVKSVFLVGVDRPSMELAHTYLTSNNNCNFTKYDDTQCFFQPQVRLYDGSVAEWLSTVADTGGINGSFVFVDVPPGNDDWISLDVQSKIKEALLGDSAVVIAYSFPPKLQDHYQLDARHLLLSQAPLHKRYGGLDYFQVYVYDEPLSEPLASSFIIMFVEGSTIRSKFLRRNVPAIENDIVQYLHHTKDGPLTLVYDGATHAGYQRPSKSWQEWRCRTPPGNQLYECEDFIKEWYDRDKHFKKTEVRNHPVKGRALVAVEPVSEGDFLLPDDASSSLRLDRDQWDALNAFIERFPEAEWYQKLRDFFVIYGFESEPLGLTGWCVSTADNTTFTNHACSESEANSMYIYDFFVNEDDEDIRFSPLQVRLADLVGVLSQATRDIAAGEEIQEDYTDFRSYPENDDKFKHFLNQICATGIGLVPVPEGDSKMEEV